MNTFFIIYSRHFLRSMCILMALAGVSPACAAEHIYAAPNVSGQGHDPNAPLYEVVQENTHTAPMPMQNEVRQAVTPPSPARQTTNIPLVTPPSAQTQGTASPALSASEIESATQAAHYQQAITAYRAGSYARAQSLFLELAQKGNGKAMNMLGLMHDRGHGVPINSKKALEWFRRSADADNTDGMYNLGRLLEQGRGTPRHVDSAAVWFRRAADLGQADAQYNLGKLYERGEGVVRNDKHAAGWYSLAATADNVEAQARLGHLYHIGKGVPVNLERATLLLYGATMRGHTIARDELLALATAHYKDKGLPKVTLFGAELSNPKGVRRASMRSALAVSKVKAIREDSAFVCDVYDLSQSVPGATEMAVCYGKHTTTQAAEQPLGFLKIDYVATSKAQADAINAMVQQRFGPPSAAETSASQLWNLGHVIVATQYVPDLNQVGLMYMMPHVYHSTVQDAKF